MSAPKKKTSRRAIRQAIAEDSREHWEPAKKRKASSPGRCVVLVLKPPPEIEPEDLSMVVGSLMTVVDLRAADRLVRSQPARLRRRADLAYEFVVEIARRVAEACRG